jgi:protein-S-isoprenylcysteine O-methyltransferase Ste14
MDYNLRATKDRFLHPSELVTCGPYAKVRNPMIMGDLFNHLSFVLLTGAVYTLYLYVIYIIIDIIIVEIENRYSVYVHFKKEYDEYAKHTPAYMNRELWLWTILYIAIIVYNFHL